MTNRPAAASIHKTRCFTRKSRTLTEGAILSDLPWLCQHNFARGLEP
jgi:hypothetical protein